MATANSGLPLIPLSPIAQSYVICGNALSQASEKLNEAKQANPPVSVGVLRRLIENVRVERHRLDALGRKMQSLEGATALFWDPETLARQIAIIDIQLYNNVLLDKRWISQLDKKQTKLAHLVDFHKYLVHSLAHQLIYWAELMKGGPSAQAVNPPVTRSDSLFTHLVRVAHLLLHAYRDFSGFAAVMTALTLPEVRRLRKKLEHGCTNRTRDMFRDLVGIISPAKGHHAYRTCLSGKLQAFLRENNDGMMVCVPWIQPHLNAIHDIVTAYTAGDNEDIQANGEIVLSAPGAHKLDTEVSLLELCQQNATIESSDALLDKILNAEKPQQSKRMSSVKPIHVEGLRAAVIPIPNLNHLTPGDTLTHHWLVSRVYLRKDQLINESIEVEALKYGERIACDEENEVDLPMSATASRRTSFIPQQQQQQQQQPVEEEEEEEEEMMTLTQEEQQHIVPETERISQLVDKVDQQQQEEQEVELHSTPPDNKEEKDKDNAIVTNDEPTLEIPIHKPEQEQNSSDSDSNDEGGLDDEQQVDVRLADVVRENQEHEVTPPPVIDNKKNKQALHIATSIISSHHDSNVSKQTKKSRLSPSAPEFVPGKPDSAFEEKWTSYPDNDSETWNGYPVPTEEDEEEVWKGYPGPNSSTDSPRRTSSQSETSEEWKGYHATKMEATWQRESALKVQEHEWQGYTLETLDEDELDSSTMMDGEFEKSRQARGQQGDDLFQRGPRNCA
ncbi:hypothetical protein K501DRAFT_286109 [Backusella circina FSU 941]|nr:hypothetical protein K501DRAFT_286109 [Backusella circina FSU 941]